MKTIIDGMGCSKYLFPDTEVVVMGEDNITVGSPVKFIIGDLNANNSTLVENVTEPDDWYGCKYNYVNGAWELCVGWVDPRITE